MAPAFPFQRHSLPSMLRSWRKEERRLGSRSGGIRRALLIALLPLVPLLALQLKRRADAIGERIQQSRDDTLAIMEEALSVTNRAARDWGHWDDAYRFMRGDNPDYPTNNLATAALFDGGAVMVLLDGSGQPRLTFTDPRFRRPSYRGLIQCLQDNLRHLPLVRSTVRLACWNEDGALYLGAATRVSNNDATAAAAGTIGMFDPLLKPEYTSRIRQRMLTLREELVLIPPGGTGAAPIVPQIHGLGDQVLALRHPRILALLGRSILEDIPLLLGLTGVALTVRGMQMLDRRRQVLRDLLVERKANQRIRLACHDLERLIEGLGKDRPLDPPLAQLPAPDAPTAATERRLARVTDRFHQVLAQTRSLALEDPLTGLPNRRHFIELLEERTRRPEARGLPLAILFVDVDRFKTINDRYGHAVGDTVLLIVTQRLKQVLRPRDVLARFGGDELALILDLSERIDATPAELEAQAREMARRLAATMVDPLRAGDQSLKVHLSIGFSVMGPEDTDIEAALRRSDEAMYAMKRQRQRDEAG